MEVFGHSECCQCFEFGELPFLTRQFLSLGSSISVVGCTAIGSMSALSVIGDSPFSGSASVRNAVSFTSGISILKEIFLDSQSVNSFVRLRSSLSVADRSILSGSSVTIRLRLGSVLSPRGSTMIGGGASVDDDLLTVLFGWPFRRLQCSVPAFSTFVVPRQSVAVPMVVGKMGREHLSLEDKMEISTDGKFPRPLPAGYELLV